MSLAIQEKEPFVQQVQDVIQLLDQAMVLEQRLTVLSSERQDLNDLALQMQDNALSEQRIQKINMKALEILNKLNQHLALAIKENIIHKAAIQDIQFLHSKVIESLDNEFQEKQDASLRMLDLMRRKLQTKYPNYQVSVRLEKKENGEYQVIPEVRR